MTFKQLKQLVDEALPDFLPPIQGPAARLYEAMIYSTLAPGKRLRPALCLYGAFLAGAGLETALPFACAIEMIHTYSLIHDDLPAMDDDALRRGRPTCHVAFDEATAILAGDALLTHAFETMLKAAQKPGTNHTAMIRAMAYIAASAGAGGMVAGQAADMDPTSDNLTYIQINKTSRLIMASLVSGLMLGGADKQMIDAFEAYAQHLGIAFQITDDLLDVTSSAGILGKDVHNDEKHDKLTAVSVLGIEESRQYAAEAVRRAKAAIAEYPQAELLFELADSILSRQQ